MSSTYKVLVRTANHTCVGDPHVHCYIVHAPLYLSCLNFLCPLHLQAVHISMLSTIRVLPLKTLLQMP